MASFFKRMDVRLAVLAYITCILIQSGGLGSIDTYRRLGVTHAFWTSAPPLDPVADPGYGVRGTGGKLQMNSGMGQSLVMLPGDIVGTTLAAYMHGSSALQRRVRIAAVAYLTFPVIDMTAIVVAFRLLCALGLSIRSSLLGALGLLMLTSFLHYSQCHQENNLMLLCMLTLYWSAAEWLTVSRVSRWVVLGALAAGFNLLIRLPTILDFAGVLSFTALMLRRTRAGGGELLWGKLRPVLAIGLPIFMAAVAIDRLYHFHRFGTFTGTYMNLLAQQQRQLNPALPQTYPFSGSFLIGFLGPFVSINKSIFLFEPTILFGIAGVIRLLPSTSRERLMATHAILIGAFAQFLIVAAFYAKFAFWSGAVAWGDRYVTASLHLACLVGIGLVAESWATLSFRCRMSIVPICLIALSVQLASVIFLPALETEQEASFGHSVFIIGQRFENIAELFTGQLQVEAIELHWDAAKPSLAPFAMGDVMPRRISHALQFVWIIAVMLDGAFLILFFRKACAFGYLHETSRTPPLNSA
jgi:hypothetical protein